MKAGIFWKNQWYSIMNVGNSITIFMNKMDWIANWHVDSFIHRVNDLWCSWYCSAWNCSFNYNWFVMLFVWYNFSNISQSSLAVGIFPIFTKLFFIRHSHMVFAALSSNPSPTSSLILAFLEPLLEVGYGFPFKALCNPN